MPIFSMLSKSSPNKKHGLLYKINYFGYSRHANVTVPNFTSEEYRVIEMEFLEINEHIRSSMQLVVGWYIFYITASVAAVAQIISEFKNSPIVVVSYYYSLAYIISTAISLGITVGSYWYFNKRYSRLYILRLYLNSKMKNFALKLPAPRIRFIGASLLMTISLTIMLMAWGALFFFSARCVINCGDNNPFPSPFTKSALVEYNWPCDCK
jgi:hypothetical protein